MTEDGRKEQPFFTEDPLCRKLVIDVPAKPTQLILEKIVPASSKAKLWKHFLFGWIARGKVPSWVLVVAWILFFGGNCLLLVLIPVTPASAIYLLTILLSCCVTFVVLWKGSCAKLSWHSPRQQRISTYAVIFLTAFFSILLIGKGIIGSTSQPNVDTSAFDIEQAPYSSCAEAETHAYLEGNRPQVGSNNAVHSTFL